MKRDLYDLSAEISGLAMIITGLSKQLLNNKADPLTPQSIHDALFGISNYLERITADLEERAAIEDEGKYE